MQQCCKCKKIEVIDNIFHGLSEILFFNKKKSVQLNPIDLNKQILNYNPIKNYFLTNNII